MPAPFVHTPRDLSSLLAGEGPPLADDDAPPRPQLAYPLGSAQADVVAMAAGIKPLSRSTLSPEQARRAIARYRHLGFRGLVAEDPVNHGGARLYLGPDLARAHAAAKADAAKDDVELGRLLGYPRCCVEAFLAVAEPRTTAAVQHARFRGLRGAGHPRLNCIDLHVFHYVPWIPCSPTCALSTRYADAIARAIPTIGPRALQLRPDVDLAGFVAQIDRALAAHRLHVFADVQVSLEGTADADGVTRARAWATALDRHPDAALSAEAREAVARLVQRVNAGQRVAVTDETLWIDGHAIARSRHMFLARFAR